MTYFLNILSRGDLSHGHWRAQQVTVRQLHEACNITDTTVTMTQVMQHKPWVLPS